jgi:hypothetical protein
MFQFVCQKGLKKVQRFRNVQKGPEMSEKSKKVKKMSKKIGFEKLTKFEIWVELFQNKKFLNISCS